MVDNLALQTRSEEVLTPTVTTPPVVTAEATSSDLPTMTYDKETFNNLMSVFKNDVGKFTQSMVKVLGKNFDDPNYLTYQGLRTGTSPVLDLFPSFSKLPPEKRRLSNEQIVGLFAFDPEGRAISPGTFLEGFTREIIPQATSVPTFMGGFAAGQAAVSTCYGYSYFNRRIRFR